jgi:thiamine biosynthesis lipoprotein ApbE
MNKQIYIFLMIITFFASCDYQKKNKAEQNNNEQKLETTVIQESENTQSKEQIDYEEALKNMDKIIHSFSDTSYLNNLNDTVKLNGNICNFNPYGLAVTEQKLILYNETFDSIYNVQIDLPVQTATWSPL